MSGKIDRKKGEVGVNDRRVRRTRSALREAMVALIIEKGFDAITVADLLKRGDVARSTFYQHYTGKESVLIDGIRVLEEYLGGIQASVLGKETRSCLAFVGPMLEHVEGHRELYHALTADRGAAVVNGAVRKMFLRLIGREVRRSKRQAVESVGLPEEALIAYVTDSFLSIMTWWLESRGRRSTADVETIFRQLIEPTLRSVGMLRD